MLDVVCHIQLELSQCIRFVSDHRTLGSPPQPEVQWVEVGAVGRPFVGGAERKDAGVKELLQIVSGDVCCMRWGSILHESGHTEPAWSEGCTQAKVELPDDLAIMFSIGGDSPTTFF